MFYESSPWSLQLNFFLLVCEKHQKDPKLIGIELDFWKKTFKIGGKCMSNVNIINIYNLFI